MGRPTREDATRLARALDIIACVIGAESALQPIIARLYRHFSAHDLAEMRELRRLLAQIRHAAQAEHDDVTARLQAADPKGAHNGGNSGPS